MFFLIIIASLPILCADCCSTWTQVQHVDWRLDPRFSLNLPAAVDQQGGVRRDWTCHHSSQRMVSRMIIVNNVLNDVRFISITISCLHPFFDMRFHRVSIFFIRFEDEIFFPLVSNKQEHGSLDCTAVARILAQRCDQVRSRCVQSERLTPFLKKKKNQIQLYRCFHKRLDRPHINCRDQRGITDS